MISLDLRPPVTADEGSGEIVLRGLPASAGIAIGPAFVFEREEVRAIERTLDPAEVEPELELLQQAVARAKRQLTKIAVSAREQLNEDAAAIFEGQILMLEDVELLRTIEKRIRSERKNAESLIQEEIEQYKTILAGSGDASFRERVSELDEVRQRLIRSLQQKRLHSTIEGEHIVLAPSLTPADTVLFSRNDVLGYATDMGGITAHAAILARSLNIPAVVGLQNALRMVKTGDMIILDGQRGYIIINPTPEHVEEYTGKLARIRGLQESLQGLAELPCVTPDGRKVELSANAEFVNEIEYVLTQGSRGIGLYRTEHLYIATGDFPSEQEQYVAYSEIARTMYPQTVIFRTFDIGGDKMLDSAHVESNPFLGWRGIRLMLDKPAIFRQQLSAILRASALKNVKLMFPMISGLMELRDAVSHLHAVQEDFRARGVAFDEAMEIGVMIEVPSAVIVADTLAREVDFFSIGTNDLVQFLLAVDRGNEMIADLYQEFHPAVLRAIQQVIDTGHRNEIWVGMCGEMAANPIATALLLGMGLDEFSMVPSVLPEIKKIIRSTEYSEAQELVRAVLALQTTGEVKQFLQEHAERRYPEFFNSHAS